MKLNEVATSGAPAPAEKPKELVVTGKKIEFSQAPQTDAEGQAAKISFGARAGAGMGQLNRGELGSIPTVIEYDSTAGDLANAAKTCCQACKHWDQREWQRMFDRSVGPLATAEDKLTLAQVRIRLKDAFGPLGGTNEFIRSWGMCRVLSDIIESWVGKDPFHWPVPSHPEATCPTYVSAGTSTLGIPNRLEVVTPAMPFGLFKPKDLDAKTIGDKRRDAVLFSASK